MISAAQFAEAARSIVGVKFHHRGRTTAGFDCVGLVFAAASLCGLSVQPFTDYERTPREDVLLAAVADRCGRRDWAEWREEGRVLVLRQRSGGKARHFAISTGGGWVVHQDQDESKAADIAQAQDLVHSVWLVRGVLP